jgi:geranylgeranyl pyrophosphate synthase
VELAVKDILATIQPTLLLVEEKLREGVDEMFLPLGQGLRNLLDSGGKRLRPALVIFASRIHPGAPLERVISLAASVETLHTATLVHDDLIDGATVRRGRRTLNATWPAAATVLAGDYLFARAAKFAAETENTRVVTIFAETLMTICEGELYQLFGAYHLDQDLESYYRRIFSKTASLFAASTEAGATLSGADAATIQALREYGKNLGMSFQIQDDLLDIVGDERRLGKPTGSDLRQGIVTLPVYYFLRHYPGERERLERALQAEPAERERAIAEIVEDIRSSPAVEDCRREAGQFAERARQALAPLPDVEEKRYLLALVTALLDRDV